MNRKTPWVLLVAAVLLGTFTWFVERPARDAMRKPRDRHIFARLNSKSITAIQWHSSSNIDIRAERTPGGWRLTRPVAYRGDASAIERLFQQMSELEWQGRISIEEMRKLNQTANDFGLETPAADLTVELSQGRLILQIGASTALNDQRFVQLVGDSTVYLIGVESLAALPMEASSWRDRRLTPLAAEDVRDVKMRSAQQGYELERNSTNNLWRVIGPVQARADQNKIANLLSTFSSTRVDAFVSDDPAADFDGYGLMSTAAEVAFSSLVNTQTVLVGRSPTNDPTHAYVRLSNQPNIFLVEKKRLEPWLAPHSEFREKHLFDIPAGQIGRITISGPEKTELIRKTSNEWAFAESRPYAPDDELVNQLLSYLARTEVEFEKATVTDFAAYGLATPAYRFQFFGTNGPSQNRLLAEIDFGKSQGETVFVRRADAETAVNLFKLRAFQELPKQAWQFRPARIWSFEPTNVTSVSIRKDEAARNILRKGTGEWGLAPGSQGILNIFAFEEALFRLGHLKVEAWLAQGESSFKDYGFPDSAHLVTLSVQTGGKLETRSIWFFKPTASSPPCGATRIDGIMYVFEIPWDFYLQFVESELSIPIANGTR